MLRVPWEADFPDVIVHTKYNNRPFETGPSLKGHSLYQPAKGERDVASAMKIIDDLASETAVKSLRHLIDSNGGRVRFIAPAAQPGDSNNAIAVSYAQWLAHELDQTADKEVFQQREFKRDMSDAWFRIAHNCSFYGEIDKYTPYVIVDDVITLGGTVADLRAFIDRKGGRVIGISTLASDDGQNKRIRLDEDTRKSLENIYGNGFSQFCRDLFGYSFECFTNDEGRKVRDCAGHVKLKQKVLRARDAGHAQGSGATAKG